MNEAAASLEPDDHGTLGNLACSFLLTGRVPEATQAIEAALRLVPEDPINVRLQRIIADVADGRRPQPSSMAELQSARPGATPQVRSAALWLAIVVAGLALVLWFISGR